MNISPAANSAANVNTQGPARQTERTQQVRDVVQMRTRSPEDTYVPGNGTPERAAATEQANRARDTADNRAAERNARDTNAAAAARPRNEAAGTTIDLVA